MKNEDKMFGQILLELNSKVNRRSTYLHNISLKYHRGMFSHRKVISNLKDEQCFQTPRAYVPIELKAKNRLNCGSRDIKRTQFVEKEVEYSPLNTSLAKLHFKAVRNQSHRLYKRTIISDSEKRVIGSVFNPV